MVSKIAGTRNPEPSEELCPRRYAEVMTGLNPEFRSTLAALVILLGAAVSAPAQEFVFEEPREFVLSVDPAELENCFPRAEEAQGRLEGGFYCSSTSVLRESS